jgi:hypothetical protein
VPFRNTFFAFKAQLLAFVEYLRTGRLPFPFAQTVELMKIVIAGIRSRQEHGRPVSLSEIQIKEAVLCDSDLVLRRYSIEG